MLASNFIQSVKRRASVPTAQDLLTDEDILALANEEMSSNLIPWLLKASEEHLTVKKDVLLVSGTSKYQLPARSAGMKLRDVQIVQGSNVRSLRRLFVEDRTGDDYGFFLEGNEVEVQPTPTGDGSYLRFTFHRSASNLVSILSVARINAISGSDVTVDSLPSAVSAADTIDLIPATSPFYSLADDVEITGTSGLTLTLSSIPANLAEGDYVCVSGETPLVQLPKEITPLLVSMVIVRVHEALGKTDQMKISMQDVDMQKNNLQELISPRIDGEPKKIRLNALSRR